VASKRIPKLTDKQAAVVGVFDAFRLREDGGPTRPTSGEIARALGVTVASVHSHFGGLIRKGFFKYLGTRTRPHELSERGVKWCEGRRREIEFAAKKSSRVPGPSKSLPAPAGLSADGYHLPAISPRRPKGAQKDES
jgi:hypothetical protein